MDLTAEALAHLADQALAARGAKQFQIAGETYVDQGGRIAYPPAPPLPVSLQTVTLAGLIDYAGKLAEGDRAAIKAAHVSDPYTVHLLGATRKTWEDRPVYARAVFPEAARRLPLDRFVSHSELMMALLVSFDESDDRSTLLGLLRAVVAKSEVESTDDGFSQLITVRKGVTLLDQRPVSNPVRLRPRRSFAEVDAPEELFVVRLQPNRDLDYPPSVGLFQVGEAWLPSWIAAVGAEVGKRLKVAGLGDLPVIA